MEAEIKAFFACLHCLRAMFMSKVISYYIQAFLLMISGALTTFNAFGQGSPQMNLPRMTLNAGMH
jgi:hypothetical protein